MSTPSADAAPYTTALAAVYDRLGLTTFTAALLPRLIPYLQGELNWYGRRVLDLGCGTGTAARWLAQHTMNVTAVDHAPELLAYGKRGFDASGLGLQWMQGDIRKLSGLHEFDLAVAIDVMNELASLRDLEAVLAAARGALAVGKLLAFDLHTTGGLARRAGISIVHNTPDTFITAEQSYDHERQILTCRYHAFEQAASGWTRRTGQRTLRGYPVQAIGALLARVGFQLLNLIAPDFSPVDTAAISADRVIFVAYRLPEGV